MSMQSKQNARTKHKHKKNPAPGEPYMVTRALTHIRLVEVNPGKLAALDVLAPVYLDLCQQYVTLFCTEERPDKLRTPCYTTVLSERWQRVAIMQAAGIARSWRSNYERALVEHLEAVTAYQEALELEAKQRTQQKPDTEEKSQRVPQEPKFRDWNVPTLREWCLQANINVVICEPSQDSTYDYWLRVSTLEKYKTLLVPVKLAPHHKEALTNEQGNRKSLNTSVTLTKRNGTWWVTLTYDEMVTVQTPPDAMVVGIDVGIANFVTTSTGKHYGTMHGKLRAAHKRDRAKRRRKAKLRACLVKKGIKKLPSTSSRRGQRLIRQTRQEVNTAVKQCFEDHPDVQFGFEQLSVASMRFKAKSMNAYLKASHLGQIPKQIQWNATKRGVRVTSVKSAYSSQECSQCHYTDRKNRPDQKTFFCQVCGYKVHADINAATTIAGRVEDKQLAACTSRPAIKALLMQRHEQWKHQQSLENTLIVTRKKRTRSARQAP